MIEQTLQDILTRLDRIEAKVVGSPTPRLVRAKEALQLFRGTRAQFYRLVLNGEIQQIRYEPNADPLYNLDQLCSVIANHTHPPHLPHPEGGAPMP